MSNKRFNLILLINLIFNKEFSSIDITNNCNTNVQRMIMTDEKNVAIFIEEGTYKVERIVTYVSNDVKSNVTLYKYEKQCGKRTIEVFLIGTNNCSTELVYDLLYENLFGFVSAARAKVIKNTIASQEIYGYSLITNYERLYTEKRYYERAYDSLLEYSKNINKYEYLIRQDIENNYLEKVNKEIELIKENKYCKDVEIKNGSVIIYTVPLYMTDENLRRFYLGSMMFNIQIESGEVTIKNIDNKRKNYWGTDGNHPHVSYTGHACFGNSSAIIADEIAQKEIYACFLTLIAYCQTVDIHDVAGAQVISWDEVDDEGNVIKEGHSAIYCDVCGRELSSDDDYVVCDECGNTVCCECYEEVGERLLCSNCIDYYCTTCNYCGELIERCDAVEVMTDEGNVEFYCEECYNDLSEERGWN